MSKLPISSKVLIMAEVQSNNGGRIPLRYYNENSKSIYKLTIKENNYNIA